MSYLKKEKHLWFGLFLILASSISYFFETTYFEPNNDTFSFMFFLHYGMAITYCVTTWARSSRGFWNLFGKKKISSHIIILVLFNISAYSLNQSIPVFNQSTSWLIILLLIENTSLTIYTMLKKPSTIVTLTCSFLFSFALVFNIYQAFMILPAAPFGLVGSLFLGIPLLLFVPFFYIYGLICVFRSYRWSTNHFYAFSLGLIISFSTIAVYIIRLQQVENSLLSNNLSIDAPYNNKNLPDWISMAQQMNENVFTEYYLKTGLVYQGFTNYDRGFSSIMRSSLIEKYMHDPLITIASVFTKNDAIDDKTKIKVLNYLYNSRHQSAERFWSGENLKSKQVVTNVEIFPKERLSFTELIITVDNDKPNKRSRWRTQQEAFYTFQLPEGGVVTSLSLWINGTEEKGILTSKKKAKKAYNTIVGKERRDPSVVYWMEGNQIRVRVFPCTPDEDRKFKIGVTSPLIKNGNTLIYDAITFIGPDYSDAKSSINIVSHGAEFINSSIDFEKKERFYSWTGDYKDQWYVSVKSQPIQGASFSFQNETYELIETKNQSIKFDPKVVYLDVSNKWTEGELKRITSALSDKSIRLFSTSLKALKTDEILDTNISSLPSFTLFPFHKIQESEQAIVITKGDISTPNFADLDKTSFKKELFRYFKDQSKSILVVDIGKEPSDFMRSLKEFGVINYQNLDEETLIQCFRKKTFPSQRQNPNVVELPKSNISIVKSETTVIENNNASDHMMRLFYYQKIMDSIGEKYFSDTKNAYLEDHLVNQASIANIVTPISSLIVLESQQDYDRFGIKQNKDSLGNASINNSGAVPEPHEWAMIIVGIGFLFFLYWRSTTNSIEV